MLHRTDDTAQYRADRKNLHAIITLELFGLIDRIGADEASQISRLQTLDRRIAQYCMHTAGIDRFCAFVTQHLNTGHQRTGRIDDIVYEDRRLAVNITDQVHRFGHIRFRATLIDDRQWRMQHFRQLAGTRHTAMIRRNDNDIFKIQ